MSVSVIGQVTWVVMNAIQCTWNCLHMQFNYNYVKKLKCNSNATNLQPRW
jgi:hypothetical protein